MKKVIKPQWRTIYNVIAEIYFGEDFFPEYFIRHCKRNATIPQNIPNEIRNKIKKLALEAGLYS